MVMSKAEFEKSDFLVKFCGDEYRRTKKKKS